MTIIPLEVLLMIAKNAPIDFYLINKFFFKECLPIIKKSKGYKNLRKLTEEQVRKYIYPNLIADENELIKMITGINGEVLDYFCKIIKNNIYCPRNGLPTKSADIQTDYMFNLIYSNKINILDAMLGSQLKFYIASHRIYLWFVVIHRKTDLVEKFAMIYTSGFLSEIFVALIKMGYFYKCITQFFKNIEFKEMCQNILNDNNNVSELKKYLKMYSKYFESDLQELGINLDPLGYVKSI